MKHLNETESSYRNGQSKFVRLVTTVLMCIVGTTAYAQDLIYHEPHTGRTILVDSQNPGKYAKSLGAPHLIISSSAKGISNLTFKITFADVTANNDLGFDDPALGATRQATVATVVSYINDVLNETSGATIDIEFDISETDASGPLAFAGTFWNSGPNRYDNGFAYEHITTGVDPLGAVADIFVTFDFGYTWNSDTGTPTFSEIDLSTVLLHELTHGLGFVALTDSNGNSQISLGNPGIFTDLADGLSRTTPNFDLWNAAFTFVGVSADLVSDDVVFTGANATAANSGVKPRVYAPGSFSNGSSISHWDLASFPNQVMKPAFAPGFQMLEYGDVDKGFLKDIGYALTPPPGPPTSHCPDAALLNLQHEDVLADIPLVLDSTTDLDANGIPDQLEVALFLEALCSSSISFHDEAQAVYDANLTLIESGIPLLVDVKEFAAAAAAISDDFIGATPLAPLSGTLSSVTTGAKAGNEPFAEDGDLDLDGVTNLEEFNNTEASGGDYVQAASNPMLNGSEGPNPIPVTGIVGLGTLLLGLGVLGRKFVQRKP